MQNIPKNKKSDYCLLSDVGFCPKVNKVKFRTL